MAKTKIQLIPKVTSLGDLLGKASVDPRYAQLALLAASNLGWHHPDGENVRNIGVVSAAIRWLRMNETETGEPVVGEVNFCRDLVTVTETEF